MKHCQIFQKPQNERKNTSSVEARKFEKEKLFCKRQILAFRKAITARLKARDNGGGGGGSGGLPISKIG